MCLVFESSSLSSNFVTPGKGVSCASLVTGDDIHCLVQPRRSFRATPHSKIYTNSESNFNSKPFISCRRLFVTANKSLRLDLKRIRKLPPMLRHSVSQIFDSYTPHELAHEEGEGNMFSSLQPSRPRVRPFPFLLLPTIIISS
jgi:hypothetical protein